MNNACFSYWLTQTILEDEIDDPVYQVSELIYHELNLILWRTDILDLILLSFNSSI